MCRIYVLVDPRDGAVRYVGQTRCLPSTRLRCHLSAKKGVPLDKLAWLAELRAVNLEPSITVVETVESPWRRDHFAREEWWTEHPLRQGAQLFNRDPYAEQVRLMLSQESQAA